MALVFKKLKTLEEMQDMKDLEYHVWRMDSTPILLTFTTSKNGGLSLGVYDDDQLVGFSYGFPGYGNGQTYLCSHMLGVHRDYRHQGLGRKLKEQQREEALAMGYGLITWTYDPLETANGNLNLHKLGGLGARYYENHYGDVNDGLNDGLPTDRFLVEWWIESTYPDHRPKRTTNLNPKDAPHCLSFHLEGDLQAPGEVSFPDLNKNDLVFMPVPLNFQDIKKQNPKLALSWRMKTRACIQTLLKAGFVANDLIKKNGIGYYLFVKRKELTPLLKRRGA